MNNLFNINLTPEQFEAAKTLIFSKVGADGKRGEYKEYSPSNGMIASHGVLLDYSYNGKDLLFITVEHKPFLYPEGKVEAAIREWFKGGMTEVPKIQFPLPSEKMSDGD